MGLQSLLQLSSDKAKKIGISEARVYAAVPELTKAFSFYREYPDIFLDSLIGENGKLKLFFYQRVFLRAVIRHRYFYSTFPRA